MQEPIKYYVLPIEDEILKICLNGILLLGNPREKSDAHITVRGPYSPHSNGTRIDLDFSEKIIVKVIGVDNFFGYNQNTVFLRCHSTELTRVHWKPSYPDFTPHITLYDGSSGDFAQLLFQLLLGYSFLIRLEAHRLVPLRKQFTVPPLWIGYTENRLSNLIGKKLDLNKSTEFDEIALIKSITEIIDFMCEKGYCRLKERFEHESMTLSA